MATFTCWCGHTIRENSSPQDAGEILWGHTEEFYQSIAQAVQGFYDARESGKASEWLREFFGLQYPSNANISEVVQDVILAESMKFGSGIYRCPKCRRVHIHIAGSENQWESFVPENRVSGGK
jgi:hypothetical protein